MVNFTKPKFLSLDPAQQHRHLAELLRAYHKEPSDRKPWAMYEELTDYLQLKIEIASLEDRYHFHLNRSGRKLKEHNLLEKSEQTDRAIPLSPQIPVDILLDNLRSAHNVGSITRTAEAFGLGTIYGLGTTPEPSSKTAMGAEKWTTFKKIELSQMVSSIIALEISDRSIPYFEADFPESFTLALGNEERGCSPEILMAASQVVSIPMHGRKNSLNVANAFAIVAAEIVRKHPLRRVSR